MCSFDYDIPKVYYESNRKAKKEHSCSECYRVINKGEIYKYAFGVWDIKPSIFKTCWHCLIPQKWLMEECGGFLHGALEEEIEEHAFEYRKMFLYRWLIGIRRKWQSRRGQ